mmetsp:Transcript_39176/g.97048  ORF Transcript_39176/g.97048 Transcript_39176/m.97048 type:complete len:306 (+) Transcript_39176:128-1045(+)|eukprot:CAMPEP_0197577342 /NCGR_PEP_ID=MMETSP1326-20131121/2007_1 /TAXON_ID=1155430 /ORGANISM="Genus nov. species nov., Strain RCC2288" /LENGTH=305 /DNA_ID=CAMNT_0043140399 /DNA_START=112 /DNA_END=1029 /DNA_ORIENTATION=+
MSPDAARKTEVSSEATTANFGGMGIYVDGRTANELGELLKTKPAADVTARDLYNMSCMHYLEDEPMQRAAEFFELGDTGFASGAAGSSPHTILDFGSGFAGDARLIAADYPRCKVTCVELQPHIHAAAEHFTAMVGLQQCCVHECVDITHTAPNGGAPFDHLFSVLAILHVGAERSKLWGALAAAVKPGGSVYIEDYYAAAPLSARDTEQLAGVVACPYLPSKEEYLATLQQAGFVDVQWEVMNDRWLPFIATREERFRGAAERNTAVHGAALTAELGLFYSTVLELFTRGNLGGVRIRARKAAA